MKSVKPLVVLLSVIALMSGLLVVGCDDGEPTGSSADGESATSQLTTPTIPITPMSTTGVSRDISVVDTNGNTSIDLQALSSELGTPVSNALTQEEVDGLLYMREEEKLARDVYLALYEQWNLPIFQNISNSEQTHTDAVGVLLDRYGLSDPSTNKEIGKFVNRTLQGLFDQLVTQGAQSIADALKVGAAIEEIDILDLQQNIAQTDQTDIILVYQNLMKGSRNHLRSFTSNLRTQTGETYQPQYLSQAEYDAIVSAEMERGGQGRGSQGRGGQWRGGRSQQLVSKAVDELAI